MNEVRNEVRLVWCCQKAFSHKELTSSLVSRIALFVIGLFTLIGSAYLLYSSRPNVTHIALSVSGFLLIGLSFALKVIKNGSFQSRKLPKIWQAPNNYQSKSETCKTDQTWLTNHELINYFNHLAVKEKVAPLILGATGVVQLLVTGAQEDRIHTSISVEEIAFHLKKRDEADESRKERAPLPIFLCSGPHWTLVFIDRNLKTVEYYNSSTAFGHESANVTWLKQLAKKLEFTFESKVQVRLQKDDYQCGPWVCFFLNKRLQDPTFDYSTIDQSQTSTIIQEFRKEVLQAPDFENYAMDMIG